MLSMAGMKPLRASAVPARTDAQPAGVSIGNPLAGRRSEAHTPASRLKVRRVTWNFRFKSCAVDYWRHNVPAKSVYHRKL